MSADTLPMSVCTHSPSDERSSEVGGEYLQVTASVTAALSGRST